MRNLRLFLTTSCLDALTDRKDELLDGLSETVFAVATGYKIGRPLHFATGIAHGDTETAALKHRDVVVPVADGDDLRQRNP